MKHDHSSGHAAPGDVGAGPPPAADAGAMTGGGLAARLRDREAELARVLHDQAQVSYGIAHDLRAPLRAIDGFAAMLEQHSGAGLDDTGMGYLARIRAAATRMGTLIDALQALSRASHDHLDLGDVDASLLAEWALVELRDADPGREVEAEVQEGIFVRADERQLKQVFDHLLHNAWKFSAAGEPVRIRITADRAGAMVRIHVRDHGSGFDPQHVDGVFEAFQRVHAPEDGGGHGLGLAITQRIAQRLGGGVSVDTVPGEGSVFHVELPAATGGGATP